MLSHSRREDLACILTLDSILADDIAARLADRPELARLELRRPRTSRNGIKVSSVEAMGRDTARAKLLILDVRSYTLPGLRHAFNAVVGYNRMDLNRRCYTVLLGDGPPQLCQAGTTPEVFSAQLAKLRQDFHPAAFFFDPFIHYEQLDGVWTGGLEQVVAVPTQVPQRFAESFSGPKVDVREIRRYFRAEALAGTSKLQAKQRRQEKLARLFEHRLLKTFPEEAGRVEQWFSREGRRLEGEALPLHLYPMHFEDILVDCLRETRPAADRSR
jgi:hypothetical protein